MDRILRAVLAARRDPPDARLLFQVLDRMFSVTLPVRHAMLRRLRNSDVRQLPALLVSARWLDAKAVREASKVIQRMLVCEPRRLADETVQLTGILVPLRFGCRGGKCRVGTRAFRPLRPPLQPVRLFQGPTMFASLFKLAAQLEKAGLSMDQLTAIGAQLQALLTAKTVAEKIRIGAGLARMLAPFTKSDQDDRVLAALEKLTTAEEFDALAVAVEEALGRPRIRYQFSGNAAPELDMPVAELIADQLR